MAHIISENDQGGSSKKEDLKQRKGQEERATPFEAGRFEAEKRARAMGNPN